MSQHSRGRRGLLAASAVIIATTVLCAVPRTSAARFLPSVGRFEAEGVLDGNACHADSTPTLRLVLNLPAFRLDVFHQHAGPELPIATLDSLVRDTSRTRSVTLDRTVPIDVRYDLAEVRGARLLVYRDVYRYGGVRSPATRESALAALVRAGNDTATLRMDRLDAVIRRARRASTSISLDSLVPPLPTAH